jgi:hypothetical protein
MRALPAEPELLEKERPVQDTQGSALRRLDSWKSIAQYLGRDERTVRRWEKEAGLPIHRVPGGRGSSVFAYESEIDVWMRSTSAADRPTVPEAPLPASDPAQAPRLAWSKTTLAVAGLVLCAVVGTTVALLAFRRSDSGGSLAIRLTPDAVIGLGADGVERWHVVLTDKAAWQPPPVVVASGRPAAYVASSYRQKETNGEYLPGQLMEFDFRGRLQSLFEFDDRVAFGAGTYGPPWVITDFRVDDRGPFRRVAVAAHHIEWWPSIVTILDDHAKRLGTFVNSGWITQLLWLDRDRLLAAGISNAHDGAMLALLDTDSLGGTAPVIQDAWFNCTSCVGTPPLKYIVFGRSELNVLSGSEFNRTTVTLRGNRIVVRTVEVPWDGRSTAAEALYEFSTSLELLSAAYSDRYWDEHRRLEAVGTIKHTASECPDRIPSNVRAYTNNLGWQALAVKQSPK